MFLELEGGLPESVLERAGKRLRIFETGRQCDVDDPAMPVEDEPVTSPSEPHHLHVSENSDPGVLAKLPMEVEFRKIRNPAQASGR